MKSSYVTARRVNYWAADRDFKRLVEKADVSEIPCISIWWDLPKNFSEAELFQLRSYSERFRVLQFRKAVETRPRWGQKKQFQLALKEEAEVAGSEASWHAHHDPGSLADFFGLSLLREDYLDIVKSESSLIKPRTWIDAALKRRFELQFVPRLENSLEASIPGI